MTENELLKIKTEPDIGATAAVELARDYLDLESDVIKLLSELYLQQLLMLQI